MIVKKLYVVRLSEGHLEKCLVDSHRWREWQFAGMSVRK